MFELTAHRLGIRLETFNLILQLLYELSHPRSPDAANYRPESCAEVCKNSHMYRNFLVKAFKLICAKALIGSIDRGWDMSTEAGPVRNFRTLTKDGGVLR